MEKEIEKSASDIFRELDTCQNSIFHTIFPAPYGSREGGARRYAILYLAPLFATYGVLFLLAVATLGQPNLSTWQEGVMQLPFLMDLNWPLRWDMNTAMMFLISFPLFVTFLVSERSVIPQAIASTIDSNVLTVSSESAQELTKTWQARYRVVNTGSTLLGILMGIIVIYANHTSISNWKVWGSSGGVVNAPGWYLLVSLFLFYLMISIIVLRSLATTVFMKDLVDHARVRIIPFHPDRSGGLGPVGEIGLRNQYLLSVAGINILMAAWTLYLSVSVGNDPTALDAGRILLWMVGMLVVAYIVIGPIVFLGPLLPYRQAMKEEKHRLMTLVANRTDEEFQRIEKDFRAGVFTQEDSELISRLQHLGRLLDSLPVWPFDSTTLKKFFAAYVAPIVALFVTVLLTVAFERLAGALGLV